jgi:hypothetical protein
MRFCPHKMLDHQSITRLDINCCKVGENFNFNLMDGFWNRLYEMGEQVLHGF